MAAVLAAALNINQMADQSQEIITIDIIKIVAETELAFLVRIEEMGYAKQFWCPKSLCDYDASDPDNLIATMPQWVYEQNKL